FHDAEGGGFFATSGADPSVLLRMKDDYDGAEPAGNSVAAMNLVRLAELLDRDDYRKHAAGTFRSFSGRLRAAPPALPVMVSAFDFDLEAPVQVVVAGEKDAPATRDLVTAVHAGYYPTKVVLLADQATRAALGTRLPYIAAMSPAEDGRAQAYVCKHH